jgi:hypothetical protein
LGNVSAAIVDLQNIKKHFGSMMDTSYKNLTHSDADTSKLVFKVADKVRDLGIQHFNSERKSLQAKLAPNLLYIGWTRLLNTTLKKFNVRIKAYKERYSEVEEEVDEIPQMAFELEEAD